MLVSVEFETKIRFASKATISADSSPRPVA